MEVSKVIHPVSAVGLAADCERRGEEEAPPPLRDDRRNEISKGSNVTPLLPPGLGLTASDVRAQIAFADGLAEQVAFLDRNWTFLAANEAWTNAMMDATPPGLLPGSNYLEYCDALASKGDVEARATAGALRRIDAGEIARFDCIEAGDRARGGRTYQVSIYPCAAPRRQWRVMVRYDVTELTSLKQQKHRFAGQLLNAEAEERRRVARDLHDTTAQDLVVLQLTLANLKRGRGPLFREKLADADDALDRLQREIKSVSYLFHSPTPDQPSLSKDLESLARGFGQRTGLQVSLWLDDADVIDRRLCLMVHRLTQEALANVHRHAEASEVEIRLIITEQRLHLMIKDNGVGFTAGFDMRDSVGVGLRSMVERVEELGGRLVVKSGLDGTSLIASLPFHDAGTFGTTA
jgi:two-component system, NarL family, sensor kinase